MDAMSRGLEQRLAALEAELAVQRDHLQIQQLIASYGPLVDTADGTKEAAILAQLWTENGVYDLGPPPRQGRADIAALFAEGHFEMVGQGVCHLMGLPFITIDGDQALVLNYSCVFRHEGGQFHPWRVSANRWDCVRAGPAWKIERRSNRLMNGDGEALAILRGIDRQKTTTAG